MTDVTIVVAAYDRPAMLEVELHSILAAAERVRESVRILVVDDATPHEGVRKVADRVGVDYLRRDENGGVAVALVTGFEQVDSPYYALWGDDDFFLPNWFETHLARMAEGHDVVSGSYWFTDAELVPTKLAILPPVTLADLLANSVAANDGSLVRRSALDGIGWRPDLGRAMMLSRWLSLASAGKSFSTITEPTWLYRRHKGQLSARFTHDEKFMALRRQAIAEYA